jgi:peptidoglycan/LPS O-acetylase OafA/YrhL
MENDLAYRPDVDGLRAVAVVLVLIFHAFPAVLPGGFLGVDVFFVISGYVITRRLVGREESLRHFYASRVRRLA